MSTALIPAVKIKQEVEDTTEDDVSDIEIELDIKTECMNFECETVLKEETEDNGVENRVLPLLQELVPQITGLPLETSIRNDNCSFLYRYVSVMVDKDNKATVVLVKEDKQTQTPWPYTVPMLRQCSMCLKRFNQSDYLLHLSKKSCEGAKKLIKEVKRKKRGKKHKYKRKPTLYKFVSPLPRIRTRSGRVVRLRFNL